jgi:hypothetical protein
VNAPLMLRVDPCKRQDRHHDDERCYYEPHGL